MLTTWQKSRASPGGRWARDRPVTPDLLARLGFTNHAITRFGERAALGSASRAVVAPILRDLLAAEGRVLHRRPAWAPSRNRSDLLLAVGDWLLLVCNRDERRAGRYVALTVITARGCPSWQAAHRQRRTQSRPPVVALPRVSRRDSLGLAWAERGRTGEGLIRAYRRVHQARLALAQAETDKALTAAWRRSRPQRN